ERRHGYAGAPASAGGLGGPFEAREDANGKSSGVTATPGRLRAPGGLGGPSRPARTPTGNRAASRLRRGACERRGAWGALRGPPCNQGADGLGAGTGGGGRVDGGRGARRTASFSAGVG